MKSPLSISLTLLSLMMISNAAYSNPKTEIPSEQELIENQTLQGSLRKKSPSGTWGFFDFLNVFNACKYTIQVPDAVTRGTIALTFDDGPNPVTTPIILDVLKVHNAKATFFIMGAKVTGNEALIQRILDEGHMIGNHSYSHPNFHQLNQSQSQGEIRKTDKLLRQFAIPNYFRYPFGNSTCGTNDFLKSMNYRTVGWDIDTCDWAFANGQVSDQENETCMASPSLRKDYAAYVVHEVHKTQGGILLMHDIHRNTAETLDRLMTTLEQENYRFVSLDDKNIFPKLNN